MMIRKYKSWRGLALVTLLGLIMMYALIILLIKDYLINRSSPLIIVTILILMVMAIAYLNFIAYQLSHRRKEFYVRKLLGASDKQMVLQLLLESIVLLVFLVVSGMVLAELVSPFTAEITSINLHVATITILSQILVVISLVLPVVLLATVLPIRTFINYLSTTLSNRSPSQELN